MDGGEAKKKSDITYISGFGFLIYDDMLPSLVTTWLVKLRCAALTVVNPGDLLTYT